MWLPIAFYFRQTQDALWKNEVTIQVSYKILYIKAGTKVAFQKKALQNILQFITDILSFF